MQPSVPFRIWALITGRAWGKNRTESEFAHSKAAAYPQSAGFLAARTLRDVERAIIGHPQSGLLVTQSSGNRCEYKRHLGKVIWANGAFAEIHTSEEPDAARGPEYAWGVADEVGTWRRVVDFRGNTTWTNLQFGLRAGPHPQMIAGTTPRPMDVVKDLIADGKRDGSGVYLTTGTMDDNAANLPDSFIDYIDKKYGGTRLERQERYGELLLDIEGAILSHDDLDASRVDEAPELARTVIGVDPALKKKKKSDKTGIAAVGRGVDGELYALADRSCKMSPDGWSRRVVATCHEFDTRIVVAEDNVIGEAIETLIHAHDRSIRVLRRTATKSKAKRAEPILAYYERSAKGLQVGAHIVGKQPVLEDQLTQFTPLTWDGDGSPDEADAHVWGATELMLGQSTSWGDVIEVNAA